MSAKGSAPKFVDLAAQHDAWSARRQSMSGRRVLKQANVRKGEKRLVGGPLAGSAREAKTELLYDGLEVIGVRLVCTCGKTTDIYFEYGEPEELPE